jgi:dCMP deaminase
VNFDEYGILLALAAGAKSKDTTKVGAAILGKDRRTLSTGFNGPPPGADDARVDWSRPAKYRMVRHAEANALTFAGSDLTGCTLYVTGKPCSPCLLAAAAHRCLRIVWLDIPITMMDDDQWKSSQQTASQCRVELVPLTTTEQLIETANSIMQLLRQSHKSNASD